MCASFSFGFKGGMCDWIVLIPNHSLLFTSASNRSSSSADTGMSTSVGRQVAAFSHLRSSVNRF